MTKLERQKQVQKQKNILYVCCIAVIISLIVLVASNLRDSSLKAEASMDGNYVYESVLVEEGDSLWSIANKNQHSYSGSVDEYIAEIKSVNNLYSNNITAGEYLILPVYSGNMN